MGADTEGQRALERAQSYSLSPTAETISGRTSKLATAPSTCRPAWLLTTIPSQPISRALRASAAHWMPLMMNGRPPEIRFHYATSQSQKLNRRPCRSWKHTSSTNHFVFSQVCAFPCQTCLSIHVPESFSSSSLYLCMNTGSDFPFSFPTCPGG